MYFICVCVVILSVSLLCWCVCVHFSLVAVLFTLLFSRYVCLSLDPAQLLTHSVLSLCVLCPMIDAKTFVQTKRINEVDHLSFEDSIYLLYEWWEHTHIHIHTTKKLEENENGWRYVNSTYVSMCCTYIHGESKSFDKIGKQHLRVYGTSYVCYTVCIAYAGLLKVQTNFLEYVTVHIHTEFILNGRHISIDEIYFKSSFFLFCDARSSVFDCTFCLSKKKTYPNV